jgi:drug/metabolite transporter (DMT)-like permease
MTTIAASVVLVNLQPVFVVAISAVFLRETPNRRQLSGIAIAIVGAVIIALPGFFVAAAGDRAPLGNMLALSAALTAAIYYSIGRSLRAFYGIWAYVGLTYSACFIALLMFALAARVPLVPQPPRELTIFAGLALGPMLLGHTGMNWALKFLPAYVVNLTVVGEPVGGTILGMILPGIRQIPPLMTVLGGFVILAGLLVAMTGSASLARHRDTESTDAAPRKPKPRHRNTETQNF